MKAAIFVLVVALSGCAAPAYGPDKIARMNQAVSSGQCAEAYALVNESNAGVKFFNLAYVAGNCERNMDKAINYLNYGARIGNQESINELLRLGRPVPVADIKHSSDAQRDAQAASGLMLLQAAQPKPAQQTRQQSCVTRFNQGVAYTDCN